MRTSPLARLVLLAIKAYKWVFSPLFTGSCRYLPSCSEYTAGAVARHGALLGLALGASRICRCQPFGGFGCDPVPLKISTRSFFKPSSGLILREDDRRFEISPGLNSVDSVDHSRLEA